MALSAINTIAYWPLRQAGVVRVIEFAGGVTQNSEGFLIQAASTVLVQVMGSFGVGGATVTMKSGADNASFSALATAGIAFTAAGIKAISPTDLSSTKYFRLELTSGSATDTALTCIVIALGASDIV